MTTDVDVVIIGFGPGGEVLASTLGAAGISVAVIERWPEPFPLPRMITLDGECSRIVQATSADVDKGFEVSSIQHAVNFADADGAHVMSVPYPGEIGGWPARTTIFQPDFERQIIAKVETMPSVEVMRGWEAVELVQDGDGATVTIAPFDHVASTVGEERRVIKARYVVGTDGTRSFVRQKLDLPVKDFNLHERWLNFDAEIKRPLPEHFYQLLILMDPKRPHMYMPIGKRYLRLEFRVMEDETDEQVTAPEVAWDFLTKQHNLGPDDVNIMRQVVYHYHTRIAEKWRDGRVFIAGDAAHTMPPYMGQGGCAAIRDGRNLGWKLVEVLSGRSGEALLNSYEEERKPHVTTLVMGSDMLSRIVNITDPVAAENRNRGMREDGERRPPDLPNLTAGILYRSGGDTLTAPSGFMTPQGRLRRGTKWCRGDDMLGPGFQLWSLGDLRSSLSAEALSWIEATNASVAVFEDEASPDFAQDCDGVYTKFLNDHRVEFLLVRPDFYAFGGSTVDQASELIADLFVQLKTQPAAAKIEVAAA